MRIILITENNKRETMLAGGGNASNQADDVLPLNNKQKVAENRSICRPANNAYQKSVKMQF